MLPSFVIIVMQTVFPPVVNKTGIQIEHATLGEREKYIVELERKLSERDR